MTIQKPKSLIFSFPFFVLIDTQDPPSLAMKEFDNFNIRFYPPFRSAPANGTPMPFIPKNAILFLNGRQPKGMRNDFSYLPAVTAYPKLLIPGTQEPSLDLIFCQKWDDGKSPLYYPMDSIRIDILPKNGTGNDIIYNEIINLLLKHIRCITKQWWVTRSSDVLHGWVRNEFTIDQFGKPLDAPWALSQGRTPIGIECALNQSRWTRALQATEEELDVDLIDQLLLDAAYYLASSDWRRTILDAASACEMSKDITFARLWSKNNSTPYRHGKILTGWDICKHLDTDLNKNFGKSLKSEKPLIYKSIKELWDARGNIAHGKNISFSRDGSKVAAIGDEAKNLLGAARACVDWLRTL